MRRAFDQFRFPSWASLNFQSVESPELPIFSTEDTAWWTSWTTEVSAGGTVSNVSGNGQMQMGAAGGYNDWDRALLDDQEVADFDLSSSFLAQNPVRESYPAISFRRNAAWSASSPSFPQDGYVVEVYLDDDTGAGWGLEEVTAGTRTLIHSADNSITIVGGDEVHVNIVASGTLVEIRIWKNADAKPESPTHSFVDNDHATKTRHGLAVNGGPAASDVIVWTDCTLRAA